jgi:putative transposase
MPDITREFTPELLDQFLAGYKGPDDWLKVDGQLKALKAALVERALGGELTHHLGYPPCAPGEKPTGNRRNGTGSKTLKTEDGEITIEIPRDRDGSFDPLLVKKHQRRLEGFDDKVIALYARGLSMKDIQGYLREIYGTDVSPELISTVTEAVSAEAKTWQSRPLESHYAIVYLDAIMVKIRDAGHIVNKAVYLAIGVDLDGKKEALGLWISKAEGAKFWLSVLTELKNRGVEDVFILCCDGLKGLPEAVNAVFPLTQVQLCIVHMIRNSLRYVTWKDRRAVCKDLKPVYAAASEDAALEALEAFKKAWGAKYPTITPSWEANWAHIVPFLAYPDYIRRVIYTTNTIEAANRQIRKVIKTKGALPNDEAALKLIYLALKNAKLYDIMPQRDWKLALSQFAILFHDRFPA